MPESIVRNTADGQVYSVRFRRLFETESRYYRLEFVKLDLDDGGIGIAAGFRDVDGIVRKEMVTQNQLREASKPPTPPTGPRAISSPA